jgi:4-amino-4-deoxy-L-arabinose transferase-like glycosyltransferase
MPMIFFTVLGFVQCAIWLAGKDRARLGLGLTLLFGAAMAKFEGFIFLALVGCWMLLLPSARPSLKPSPRLWWVLAFGLLSALPFVCLRIQQTPVLHYESGWAGYALHHPGSTLSNWPGIFMMLLARLFVSSDFANWSGEGGQFHWIGRWDGFSSLYNNSTLGLAWLCLLLTVALWFSVPTRRQVIVWIFAMFVGATAALSVVFASLVTIKGLRETANSYTHDLNGGRYLLPVLLAWFATLMIMFFAEPFSAATTPMLEPGEPAPAGRH